MSHNFSHDQYMMEDTLSPSKSHLHIDKLNPSFKRQGSLVGYTGYYPCQPLPDHVLDERCEKYMIRGYTGFRPQRSHVINEPIIPNEQKQREIRNGTLNTSGSRGGEVSPKFNYRNYAKQLDMAERYNNAVEETQRNGLSQEMLLSIVQSKLSERVNSYSHQLTRTKRIFDTFDTNHDGVLDENEFRLCLEKINIQFDDVQCLALFAYFDTNHDGWIEWDEFAEQAMVQNPRGGTACLPKVITSLTKIKPKDIQRATSYPQSPKSPKSYSPKGSLAKLNTQNDSNYF